MRIKQGLILLLIVCIVVAEVSAAKQKAESGKKGKNEKKVKGGKYEGKQGKQQKNEHKHTGKHSHGKEEAAVEEEVIVEEKKPAEEKNVKVDEKKASKADEKMAKDTKMKNEGKKEKEAATCDCPPGPAGPPGPQGPPGECIYQPVCPESINESANSASCSSGASESCSCGKDCPCKANENKYSEAANAHGSEASHIFLTKSSSIIAIHSQNTVIPSCPLGQSKLWEGYSLMGLDSNGQSTTFDLGSSGSCVRNFMSSMSVTCDIEGQCKEGQRNDRSYWILANGTVESEPMTQEEAMSIISRCVVCDAPSAIIAIHSQSIEVPKCPAGWDRMWFGYSYLDSSMGEQNLANVGSCLKEFKNPLFIECNSGKNSCNLFESHKSSWLVAEKAPADPVEAVVKETVEKIEAVIKKEAGNTIPESSVDISRCSVCIKVIA